MHSWILQIRNTELSAVEEKIQEAINEKEMLNDLIKEKEELFKQNKKELHQLKSATSPLLKQQREAETMISNRTKEILNQEQSCNKEFWRYSGRAADTGLMIL